MTPMRPPELLTAVRDWEMPRTKRQLMSFLGFVNFYRKFIHRFAGIVTPLTDLLRDCISRAAFTECVYSNNDSKLSLRSTYIL